ncbi:uncharacterized protein LOC132740964 [Ruditapes philippinarum]|uniref:uncharacterized protein LOC132740964 n=1 Tax=Ruditapes philippinarum TaxID=129788 RepID=UPI00295AF69B|nr:uncharacterized protein LOC132740964 [Ruditapes philippinarum]
MEMTWKLVLIVNVGILVLYTIGLGILSVQESTLTEPIPAESTQSEYQMSVIKQETKEKISTAARLIHKANKHVRGSKTSGFLKDALHVIKLIMKELAVDEKALFERSSVKSKSVCPESYMGGAFGFPLYYKGFEVDKCNYTVPLNKLVTVIKYIDIKQNELKSASDELNRFVASVHKTINSIHTLIAINSGSGAINLTDKYPHVSLLQTKYKNEGFALNSLAKQVKTPYVLIARGVEFFTNDSRLERMVRELESLNVVAVGGAFRYPNGHWHKGCYQLMYRNYTLKYISGYDESFHECLFCDYIQGPFLTSSKYLKSNVFGDFNENNGLYEDWFLRIFKKKEETVICPDSMFHMQNQDSVKADPMTGFLQKWGLFKMVTAEGRTLVRDCRNQRIRGRKSLAASPCALKSNNNAVKTLMRKCVEVGITCELQEGTALGAAKFGRSLPWEKDYDIRFSFESCSKCKQLEQAFKKANITYATFASNCCTKKLKLGGSKNYKVTVNGYMGDFTGHPIMGSDDPVRDGLEPTKVLYDGQWVNIARNPGLFVRNRYGKEIYRHAEHWSYSGIKGARDILEYQTNIFHRCTSQGAHNCLDRYNADGNLQFTELLP